MKKIAYIILPVLLIIFTSCSQSDNPIDSETADKVFGDGSVYSSINWVGTDLVFNESADKNEFSLLYFRADDCEFATKLETETYLDPAVAQIMGESFNICRLDTGVDTMITFMDTTMTANQIKTLYAFSGVPNIIVLDSDWKYIHKIAGYYNASDFREILHNIRLNK